MTPYPLLFQPILKPRVWGGRRLEAYGKSLPPHENIGESWELADLPESIEGGRSVIANGPLADRTLREVIAQNRDAIMGAAALSDEGGFPLLIKLLDARENLSVQVHPDEAYAAKHPEAHLKSEAWVVLEAEPGAVIYAGLKPGVSVAKFLDDVRTGNAVNDLLAVPASAGECHYLPSGMCHALGAGVLVAEVQTPSDTTFRVYDWGRPRNEGRELHVEQAAACMRPHESISPRRLHDPIARNGLTLTPLCETEYFAIDRVSADRKAEFAVETSGLPEVWMVTDGQVDLEGAGPPVRVGRGGTVLLPAGLARRADHRGSEGWTARLRAGSSALNVRLPSPLRGKIAR